MLNRSGITKTVGAAPVQILADVDHQISVGVIMDDATSVTEGSSKLVKAGTPITVDLGNLQTPATVATTDFAAGDSTTANAVLLHDVDVTNGDANGTALIAGMVNINRVDSTTAAKLKAGVFGNLIFIKA